MLGIGNLCIGVETYPDYRARRMIDLLLAGLAQANPTTDDRRIRSTGRKQTGTTRA
jgi:hypothetical protein